MKTRKFFKCTSTLLLGLAINSTLLAGNFYCPPTVICHGKNIHSCFIKNNKLGWQINFVPDSVQSGAYDFSTAIALSKEGNRQHQYTGCNYYNQNQHELGISLSAGLVHRPMYAVATGMNSDWYPYVVTNTFYYACDTTDTFSCPLSFVPPP